MAWGRRLTSSDDLYWDACVFIRYLSGDSSAENYSDICQYVEDAKSGSRRIYASTITFAEIRQEHFNGSHVGSVTELFDDFGASFLLIDTTPNILIAAGELRSAKAVNPTALNPPNQRVIGTADAVHLMTCLHARDVLGIENIVFQTFDQGKGTGHEGKTVPIIGFERWFPETMRTERVKEVCSLIREKPVHPYPTMEGIVRYGRGLDRPQPGA